MAIQYNILFLKNFNNYFNRIIKGFEDITDYTSAVGEFYIESNINFNPNDGVSTEVIINNSYPCDYAVVWQVFTGDVREIISRWFVLKSTRTRGGQYSYTLRRDLIFDYRNNLMKSPIFVQKGWLGEGDPFIFNDEGMSLNEIKTSETLLKDATKSSWIACYLAKNAAAADVPVESVAQEITDYVTLSAIATEMGITEAKLQGLLNINSPDTTATEVIRHHFLMYEYHRTIGNVVSAVLGWQTEFAADFSKTNSFMPSAGAPLALDVALFKIPVSRDTVAFLNLNASINSALIANKTAILADLPSIYGSSLYLLESQYKILNKYFGKVIKYNNNYYTLSDVSKGISQAFERSMAYNTYASIGTPISTTVAGTAFASDLANNGKIMLAASCVKHYFHLTSLNKEDQYNPEQIPTVKTKISSNRVKTEYEAFDLVVIPVDKMNIYNSGVTIKNEEGLAKRTAVALAAKLGQQCYDVQLLPYCPLVNIIGNGQINISNLSEDTDYNFITRDVEEKTDVGIISSGEGNFIQISGPDPDHDNKYLYRGTITDGNIPFADALNCEVEFTAGEEYASEVTTRIENTGGVTSGIVELYCDLADVNSIEIEMTINSKGFEVAGIMLYCKSASFRSQLNYSLESEEESAKIETLCDKYRLCSPNYQGSFDFNLGKNGGKVDYFIAECSYKPYTPYIKVAPQFNLLYGSNFGDARGLICGGDYSLSRFDSEWIAYELNNKNYQNIFNREISNLEFNERLENLLTDISGTAGILGMGAAGGAGGASVGGVYGAAAGAIVGTAAGGAGLIADLTLLSMKHREERSLAIDKYNYRLGNIKALPYTLTKVGSFNINSKIWPFLEYYTCTPEEKEALIRKLKYESMTVMRIDNFENYFNVYSEKHYFKGELIWNLELGLDNNVFEAIYSELLKGVYI